MYGREEPVTNMLGSLVCARGSCDTKRYGTASPCDARGWVLHVEMVVRYSPASRWRSSYDPRVDQVHAFNSGDYLRTRMNVVVPAGSR